MDSLFDILLHLDLHLNTWIANFGVWIYFILFLIVFCETGLVVMPFLPGDSLLFALGALTATETAVLEFWPLSAALLLAAILGDSVNYAIGRRMGPKVFRNGRWLNHKHLESAQAFYEKHGGKTILLARFVPIIRTFAPFIAGVGKMRYTRFSSFNISGAFLWIYSLIGAGYFLGNIPWVKSNFEILVIGIVVLSLVPLVVRSLRKKGL
jgi:membrane-associated protein